jgi:excisionase family DNA binding protein
MTQHGLPKLLTTGEVAALLRTTRRAVWVMVERDKIAGVVRVGRRLLFREDALVEFLRQKSAPSQKE